MEKRIKLKRLVAIPVTTGTGAEAQEYDPNELRYIRISDFDKDGRIIEDRRASIPYSVGKDFILQNGDILVAVTGGTVGKSMMFQSPETCAYAGYLARIRAHEEVLNNYFLLYYMHSPLFDDFKSVSATKSTMENISASKYANMPVIWHPLAVQKKIVEHLDACFDEIDRVIAATQRTIEEYKKLKQSIITEAVTHGVRGPRKMKDSGVEWIGEIPEEWSVAKTKSIASRIVVGVVIKPADHFSESGTVPFLRGINVKEYAIIPEPMVFITEETNQMLSKSIVHTNDLLIVRDGSIGTACVVPEEFDGANVVSMIIVTCNDGISPQFVCYSLNSDIGKTQFNLTKIGSALTHTSVQSVSNLLHVVPPIAEQIEIVKHLKSRCAEIDRLIEAKQRLLGELEAYKKSVIYEYVTGKREVVG